MGTFVKNHFELKNFLTDEKNRDQDGRRRSSQDRPSTPDEELHLVSPEEGHDHRLRVLRGDYHRLLLGRLQAQEGGLPEFLRQLRPRQGLRRNEEDRRLPEHGGHRGREGRGLNGKNKRLWQIRRSFTQCYRLRCL